MRRHIHLTLSLEKKKQPKKIVASLKRAGIKVSDFWVKGLYLFIEAVSPLSTAELEATALKHHGVKAAYANC